MIVQALCAYYEALEKKGEIPREGWANVKVSYALQLNQAGELVRIRSNKEPSGKSKKELPKSLPVPMIPSRAGQAASGFLCDNAKFLLGLPDGNKKNASEAEQEKAKDRAKRYFEAAKTLHLHLLSGIKSPAAQALVQFFTNWNVETASTQLMEILEDSNVEPQSVWDDLEKSANLIFTFGLHGVHEVKEIADAWDKHWSNPETPKKEDAEDQKKEQTKDQPNPMRCLVTGELVEAQKIHPSIKGVFGAQSSGAALVSFNAPAACSYGKEQNLNAPMSASVAFGYTTALNYLLAQKDAQGWGKYSRTFGETTMVFWSERGNPFYQNVFGKATDGEVPAEEPQQKSTEDTIELESELLTIVKAVCTGGALNWDKIPEIKQERFFVLGLSPNAARLSVRFFLQNSFGNFLEHLHAHYQRLDICRPSFEDKNTVISLYALLRETVNRKSKNATPSPQMTGDTIRAILMGTRYPSTLYQNILLRLRAERDISYRKAAIIKAYLLRNTTNYEEVLHVDLNENTNYVPYVLGRLFSVLANIQESASNVNTIKDKYFISASTTPARIFPVIVKLAKAHLRKMDKGLGIHFDKQMGHLMERLTQSLPRRLGAEDQGIFYLGYYHETQKRYRKKDDKQTEPLNKEEN